MDNPNQGNTTSVGTGIVKANTVFGGYLALCIAIVFNLATFFITFISHTAPNWWFVPVFILVSWIGLAAAISYFRQSIYFKKLSLESKHGGLASDIGTVLKFRDAIRTVIFIIFGLAILSVILYFFIRYGHFVSYFEDKLRFSLYSVIYLVGLVVVLLLSFVFRKQGSGAIKKAVRMPFFILQEDGLIIDINYVQLFGKRKGLPFKVFFNEIDELKELSFVETQKYQRYTVGPNVQLGAESVKQQFQYMNGKIARPTVFYYVSSAGRILLIRGPNIFYLMPFSNENIDELFDAYNNFKNKSKKSKRLRIPRPKKK